LRRCGSSLPVKEQIQCEKEQIQREKEQALRDVQPQAEEMERLRAKQQALGVKPTEP
jgi:hypothetical protein